MAMTSAEAYGTGGMTLKPDQPRGRVFADGLNERIGDITMKAQDISRRLDNAILPLVGPRPESEAMSKMSGVPSGTHDRLGELENALQRMSDLVARLEA